MQTESIQDAPARGRTTWLAFLLIGLLNYMLTALGASTERLRQDLAVSRTLVGLHATFFATGMVLAGLAGDRLSRHFGRRLVVAAGASGLAAGALLIMAGGSPSVTLPAALLMGSAGSLLLVVLPALLADLHGRRSGAVLAEANSLSSLFAALAPTMVALAVVSGIGWRAALALGAAVLLVTAVAFWRGAVEPFSATSRAPVSERPGRLPGRYWTWWATLVLAVCAEFSFVFWTADELRAVADAAPALAAGAVAVFELALAAGRLAGARVLDRFGSLPVLRVSAAVAALGFLLFWSARSLPEALAGLGLSGLGIAMLYPISLARAIAAAGGRSDLGSARSTLGSGVAIGLAPFVLGLAADARGVHAAYLVVPVVLLGVMGVSTAAAARTPATER
jgi:MFS family permease